MRTRFIAVFLVLALCITFSITLCSCGAKQSNVTPSPESGIAAPAAAVPATPAENTVQGSEPKSAESKTVETTPAKPEPVESKPAESNATKPGQTFPFKDEAGRMRYRLVINSNDVETKNLPFTYPDAPKGGYYPLKDVLSYLGVECLCSEDGRALTTKINGKVLKVTAGVAEMTYGPKNVKAALDIPVYLDGCLYVPSFLFMLIFDDGIVDFNGDRSAATLDTSTSINLAASGTAGLSVPNTGASGTGSAGKSPGGTGGQTGSTVCGTCNGTGRSICTYCGGTGTKVEYQQTYDPVSKQYKMTQKSVFCPRCGPSGRVVCPTCGGTGKR